MAFGKIIQALRGAQEKRDPKKLKEANTGPGVETRAQTDDADLIARRKKERMERAREERLKQMGLK